MKEASNAKPPSGRRSATQAEGRAAPASSNRKKKKRKTRASCGTPEAHFPPQAQSICRCRKSERAANSTPRHSEATRGPPPPEHNPVSSRPENRACRYPPLLKKPALTSAPLRLDRTPPAALAARLQPLTGAVPAPIYSRDRTSEGTATASSQEPPISDFRPEFHFHSPTTRVKKKKKKKFEFRNHRGVCPGTSYFGKPTTSPAEFGSVSRGWLRASIPQNWSERQCQGRWWSLGLRPLDIVSGRSRSPSFGRSKRLARPNVGSGYARPRIFRFGPPRACSSSWFPPAPSFVAGSRSNTPLLERGRVGQRWWPLARAGFLALTYTLRVRALQVGLVRRYSLRLGCSSQAIFATGCRDSLPFKRRCDDAARDGRRFPAAAKSPNPR